MGKEIVGVRRLYDALGCNTADVKEIHVKGTIAGDKLCSIYIGPNPPLGVLTIESDHYGIPGKEAKLFSTNGEYKSDCYLEIVVSIECEASDEISNGLQNKDDRAKQELLGIINNQTNLFEKLLDCISGILGLKFHRQLVLKPLVENPLILSGPEAPVSSYIGPAIEMLEQLSFNEKSGPALGNYLQGLNGCDEESLADAGGVFHWLIKAWKERDSIARFLYLFIPLEAILQSDDVPNEAHENIEALIELVRNAGDPNQEKLLSFLEMTKKRYGPNLNARFEDFARKAAIPGWEADVVAFGKYNRMRNLLVHAGKRDIRTHINIEKETRTLEDLVERYLCIAFLGDHDVYASRWRPPRVQ